jgi:hypothetical protein
MKKIANYISPFILIAFPLFICGILAFLKGRNLPEGMLSFLGILIIIGAILLVLSDSIIKAIFKKSKSFSILIEGAILLVLFILVYFKIL